MIYLERPADFAPKMEVVACFLVRDGKFLLLHRQDHKPQGNTWGLPGGKLEKNESLLQAIARELAEEVGHMPQESDLEFRHTVFIKYPDVDFIYHMYSLQFPEGVTVMIDPQEHKDFAWVTLEESLKMNLIPDEDPCIRLVYNMT